ncbi:MAG: DNA repair protein RecN [Ruminococcaceae bacterium]|nr:DNA repair protein RecN [Oscillospiraceae bacterium]
MLRSLHIENIAVIRRLDLDFQNGFSVLTGETGAGKSIIIDSINLLLGNRVSRDIVRSGETVAKVSAVFEELSPAICEALDEMGFPCEDSALILQKTLHADGKSQVRLNGQSITQSLQREISRMLVSIHGQSDNQKLLQKGAHRELLDAYAHTEVLLSDYRAQYTALCEVTKRISALSRDEAEKLRMREMLQFQIADIDALKLCDGEEERLTKERDRLLNLEQINRRTDLCYRAIKGGEKVSALSLLSRADDAMRGLCGIVDGCETLSERLQATMSELEDIAEHVLSFADDDREDPTARIDRIEERLEGISKLKRKYGGSIAEILAFRARAAEELETIDGADELLEKLSLESAALRKKAEASANALTAARRDAAKSLQAEVTASLSFLDMPRVSFAVSILPTELCESGADEIEFLIATNVGEPLHPMIRIASGGELSRIMLALRSVINDRDGAATVIFDEVDTGVSGKTARKVGMKLHDTSKQAQVLCVTHSAQIASLADTHYLIRKSEREGRAETNVSALDRDGRIEEIARILGGIEITDVQRDAAREMLGLA